MKNIEQNVAYYINSKGIFILIAILENSEYKDKLKEMLTKHKKTLEAHADSSGAQLLLKLVFEK